MWSDIEREKLQLEAVTNYIIHIWIIRLMQYKIPFLSNSQSCPGYFFHDDSKKLLCLFSHFQYKT